MEVKTGAAKEINDVQQPLVPPEALATDRKQPNVIFILTDDQDLHMSSLDYMPHLQSHLVEEGTTFTVVREECYQLTAAGGYPKFVSQGFNDDYFPLWMQDAGYDTYYVGKLFNAQSTTNYNKPFPRGWNGSDFLLDPFTYEYLNATMQRNEERWGKRPIHEDPRSYEGQYATDVLAKKSYGFLDQAIVQRQGEGRPFFLTIAPTAPHSNVHINIDLSHGGGKYTEKTAIQSPPVPAKRHEHLFEDVIVPRTPDFNPDQPNPVSWLRKLPKQNQTNINSNDHWYRQRLRALQAVDEMIPPIVEKLQNADLLDDTYIFFSSDNGYHIGQHRLQPGKQCAYETDINVPMVVRGPGVGRGRITDVVSSHIDLAPTFLQLAGVDIVGLELRYGLDGAGIPLHALLKMRDEKVNGAEGGGTVGDILAPDGSDDDVKHRVSTANKHEHRQEHVNIEMWGIIMSEGRYGQILYPNHTYKALRVIAADGSYNLAYTVWCTNEHELYDLRHDPHALRNLYGSGDETVSINLSASLATDDKFQAKYVSSSVDQQALTHDANHTVRLDTAQVSISHLLTRLDALLMVLKTCKGRQCTHPWEQLHPSGDVIALRDALDPGYDDFYEREVAKVSFGECEQAYVLESEGPVWDPDGLAGGGKVRIWPEMLT
ncbi:hypothetical protein PMZ80_002049 [Knufia obscura]|uniref:Sulfatase N-terminal domain-containing protein n=2 Tax=Knufia TaxID=430999 RepID=A0AAN8EQL9_9EURO|nr:hypothetical protein PMZ80_002049 [Knufia obscura]KAK5953865.1 hypothetical protein OHC33_005135 [Knufia fluminis]